MDSSLIDQRFFTSAEAAQITRCTARQLQYWRQKDVVVPTINATGTGRTVYYSLSDLLQLTTMEYLMSLGLTYEVCRQYLATLKASDPNVFKHPEQYSVTKRFMLLQREAQGSLELCPFAKQEAVDAVANGRAVIPVWPEILLKRLEDRLLVFGIKVSLLKPDVQPKPIQEKPATSRPHSYADAAVGKEHLFLGETALMIEPGKSTEVEDNSQ
ncbi:MerR family transcriptional regulator [Nodosilinea sp. LEGE 07298]|uniref:MerR family transcriptional regulator n=1 Tax=Nodosilinea sp. LEGE 07298 TaxID=2777970 RepID=UPI0018817AB2|nr:MerR family transcriptional regulator [Nodosilinea sp. LEGE 07298]MBE9107906.1 MerR family transcriptional regulator [Nodosilinea sp. LEGE 07298]